MLIVDTDPGLDDLVALAISARRGEPIVVTTVFGNAPIDVVTENAAWIAAELGIGSDVNNDATASDVLRVYRGAGEPVNGEPIHAMHVHGADGIGGFPRRDCRATMGEQSASDAIVAAVEAAAITGQSVQLLALGPLTNLAHALAKLPTLPSLLRSLVIMGGAPSLVGNASAFAEFNIAADPVAADIVFASFSNITLVTWDLCRQLQTSTASLAKSIRPDASLVRSVLTHVSDAQPDRMSCIPDAVAAAIAIDESLVADGRHVAVVSVHDNSPLRGATPTFEPSLLRSRPEVWLPTRLTAQSLVEITDRFLA